MEFAIVRFTNEEDAPGIISTRWIDTTSNSCWFPNVVAEESRKRLIIAHALPERDWYKCPIKLLKKFASYDTARSLLREAEEISISELEAECLEPCRRKKKIIRFPGEKTSSADKSKELCIKNELYSPPPTSTSNSSFLSSPLPSSNSSFLCSHEELPVNQSNDVSNVNFTPPSSTVSTAAIIHIQASCDSARSLLQDAGDVSRLEFETEGLGPHKRRRKIILSPGEESSSDVENKGFLIKSEPYSPPLISTSNSSFLSQTPLISSITSLTCTREELSFNQSNDLNSTLPSSTCSTASSHFQELYNKMDTMANNQRNLWQAMKNLTQILKRIEQKLDLLLANCSNQVELPATQDEEELTLMSSLPLGVDDFEELEKKISIDNNTKRWLVNICMTVDGREPKILACNLMRKLLLDEVGLKYSLTGKSIKKDASKKSFEETEVCKLILAICFRHFKDARLNVLREAISDWLMQAKFRKSRREQRSSGHYDVSLTNKVFDDL